MFYDVAGNMISDNYDVIYGYEVGEKSWSGRKDFVGRHPGDSGDFN